jgi:hypothetical protein
MRIRRKLTWRVVYSPSNSAVARRGVEVGVGDESEIRDENWKNAVFYI